VTRRTMSRALVIAGASLCLGVAACGDDDEEAPAGGEGAAAATEAEPEAEAPKIALFTPLKNSYVNAVVETSTETAEGLGGSVEVFDANFDAQRQSSQIQDAIASQKFNAFIVYPLDAAGVVPVVEEAIAADIEVATETTPVGPRDDVADPQVEGQAVASVNPPYLDGKSTAEAVKEACADRSPCEVIHILGDFAFYYDVGFLKGLKEGIAGSEAKIVAEVKGEYQADPAYNAVREALQANEGVDVMTSTSDVMMGGAERAVTDAGLTPSPEEVALIGNGGSDVAFKGVQAGTWWGSLVWLPDISAKRNVEMLAAAINDEPIDEPGVYTSELSPIGLFLKPDNAGEFTPQWAGN
jgi:ribose transport system substrate-binding protein